MNGQGRALTCIRQGHFTQLRCLIIHYEQLLRATEAKPMICNFMWFICCWIMPDWVGMKRPILAARTKVICQREGSALASSPWFAVLCNLAFRMEQPHCGVNTVMLPDLPTASSPPSTAHKRITTTSYSACSWPCSTSWFAINASSHIWMPAGPPAPLSSFWVLR